MGDEADFLPANKHKGFLQIDRFTLSLFSLNLQSTQKKPVYNIFVISHGKYEG